MDSFQFERAASKKVAYGGINGTCYKATTTRKSRSDGVINKQVVLYTLDHVCCFFVNIFSFVIRLCSMTAKKLINTKAGEIEAISNKWGAECNVLNKRLLPLSLFNKGHHSKNCRIYIYYFLITLTFSSYIKI